VFTQLSWQNQLNGTLDLATAQGVFLIIPDQLTGFHRDPVETVVYERVHYAHRFLGDPGFGVHLFQNAVDVHAVGFDTFFGTRFGGFCLCGGGFGVSWQRGVARGGGDWSFLGWHF
jgi:hypothetical protein